MIIYLIYGILILATVSLNTIAIKSKRQGLNSWLTCGLPATVMVVFSWLVSFSNFCGDFNKSYYPAGRLIIEDPSRLYEWGKGLGFVNIPIIAVLFTPISFFNKLTAQIIITILGLAAIVCSCYLIWKLTNASGWRKLAIAGLILVNGPLYYSLKQGNSTHFVLLLLIAALFCMRDKREVWVGIVLAIASLIKIPLFLFGIYFAMRGRWRVVLGFSSGLVGIVAASILLFGLDLHITWFEKCVLSFAGKPLAAFNVQSVDGFLARLLYDVDLKSWQPLEVGMEFKVWRYLLISILVGSSIWVCWRSRKPIALATEYLEFSIVLCLAQLISPISWTHYYLYLLLPLCLWLCDRLAIPPGQNWNSLVLVSAVLVSLPVILVKPIAPIFEVLISHYFLGGVLLLGIFLAARFSTADERR
ncbi:glycosyltransferase family 87 protein [Aerosakkonema sp. BLCC-F183]|uniref:glycosyltransferase family 87 protein n=1 Tax=Aerosakkonema sp. BLCC-F183 TaxID=3342834 RepID=UPI0035BB18A0